MKRGPSPSYRARMAAIHNRVGDAIRGLDESEEAMVLLLEEVDTAAALTDRADHRKRLISAGKRVQLALVQLRLVNLPRPPKVEE